MRRSPKGAESTAPSRTKSWFLPLLTGVLLATALAWAPSLDYGFVYDDREQILQNTRIRMPDYPAKAFSEDLWRFRTPNPDADHPGGQYYRPAFALWLWGNWQQFGDAPKGWHGTNLLLHLLDTLLVGLLARRLGALPLAAAAAALLFGLHPIHAESVAWVAGSTDTLLAAFTLGSLLLAFRDRREKPPLVGRLRFAASLALFALAALTKETAYVFPLFFAGVRWFELSKEESPAPPVRRAISSVLFAAPYLAIAVVVFFVRLRVIGFLSKPLTDDALTGAQTLRTLPRVLLEYVSMAIFSAPAGLGHPVVPPASFVSAAVFVPLLLLAVAIGAILLLRPWRSAAAPLLAAGILAPMLPVLNLTLLIPDALVQDRYLYLSSAFAVVAAIPPLWAFVVRKKGEAATIGGVLLLAVLCAFRLVTLRDTFRDEVSLFRRATRDAPRNGIFQHRLGLALLGENDVDGAITALRRATELDPDDWVNAVNLALAESRKGRLAEAAAGYGRAIEIAERTGELAKEPRFAGLAVQRAKILRSLHRDAEAVAAADLATKIDPTSAEAWELVSELAFDRNDLEASERAARKLIAVSSESPVGWGSLGSVLTSRGDFAGAEAAFLEAGRRDPSSASADIGLAQLYLRNGRTREAEAAVRRAAGKNPDHPAVRALVEELSKKESPRK